MALHEERVHEERHVVTDACLCAPGAFCNGCAQIERAGGCFASSSMVQVEGRGRVALADVSVGEAVLSADLASREQVWTRVIYMHTHVDKSATVGVGYAGGRLWLTRTHPVLLASGQLRKAADIKVRRGRVMSRDRCSCCASPCSLSWCCCYHLHLTHCVHACVRASAGKGRGYSWVLVW